MALYRKNCMTLFVDINVIATYDINDINLEVDINVSLPLGTMLALRAFNVITRLPRRPLSSHSFLQVLVDPIASFVASLAPSVTPAVIPGRLGRVLG